MADKSKLYTLIKTCERMKDEFILLLALMDEKFLSSRIFVKINNELSAENLNNVIITAKFELQHWDTIKNLSLEERCAFILKLVLENSDK